MADKTAMEFDDILNEFERDAGATLNQSKLSKSEPISIYNELVKTMINERMAPELLEYNTKLVELVLSKLSAQQQQLLDYHEYSDQNGLNSDFKLQLMIIETEIERLNYLLRLYFRTRLSKIDDFTIFYLNNPKTPDLLSPNEVTYMNQHFKILTQLYNSCFLKKMPKSLTLLNDTSGGDSMIVTPDLDQPVFVKYVSEISVTFPMGEYELELVNEGIYVVKYSLIKDLVASGDVVLI